MVAQADRIPLFCFYQELPPMVSPIEVSLLNLSPLGNDFYFFEIISLKYVEPYLAGKH
jgi:hypothetical protein